LERFHLEPELDVGRAVQRPYPARPFFEKRTEPAGATPTEVSFGPFRLLRTQFLLLEGDKPVPLGSRALEILIALLERHGELVSQQDLMARVWPNVFVEPANLTVHMSAQRRRCVTAGMGIASSSTSPDAATVFRRLLCRLTRIERNWRSIGKFGEALPWLRQ
jgi:hypothetical protein